jgi:Cdc6-like AAA superfamily ATPase
MNNKEKSPFTPGSPVPYELFVGRTDQIQELIRLVDQTSLGKQENVFLSGDRGIGKSSLASFLRHFVATRKNVLGIHVFIGKAATLEEMVCLVFEQILKETQGQSWFENISQLFGKYIKQIGLFGISVSFNPPMQDLRELARNFPEALNNLLGKIGDHKAGLFIALDDVNGLVEKTEFANWYKSFVDEIATHYPKFPVFIILIGLPAYSGPCWTLIPADSGHLFRSIPDGHSDSFRPPIPEHSGHP